MTASKAKVVTIWLAESVSEISTKQSVNRAGSPHKRGSSGNLVEHWADDVGEM
jgi:hypothetical protein